MDIEWRQASMGGWFCDTLRTKAWLDPMATLGPSTYWTINVNNGHKSVYDERETLDEAKTRAEEIIREELS